MKVLKMANRILRDWTQSENIDLLSEKAEVFFVRLIMKADDFGCYYGNTKLLKSHLYPLRTISEKDISALLNECIKAKLILYYEVEGKNYLKINNFNQRLRQMTSKFPQFADNCPPIDGISPPETKGSRKEDEVEGELKIEIPAIEVFLDYCKTIEGINYAGLEFSFKAKYEAWVENGWKDGNNNEIKNWKTKIKNTIPYMKEGKTPPPKQRIYN
tara:strand:- start:132 stop:776 length:645 start_codon:yes stop_codon:yes gene_type:complete